MKSLSVLGIVASAAIALICATVPVSASATVLCPAQQAICPNPVGAPIPINGDLEAKTNFVIENELGFVTCTESHLAMTIAGFGGAGMSVLTKVAEITANKCTRAGAGGPEACAVTQVNTGVLLEEQWNGVFTVENPWKTGAGSFAVLKGMLGEPGYYVKCGVKINCTFLSALSGLSMAFGGGASPILVMVWPAKTMGTACPKAIPTLRANWRLSTPAPIWLARE
jgi:hypothetical protein